MKYTNKFDYNTYIIDKHIIDCIPRKHIFNSEKLNLLVQSYCKEVLRLSANRSDGLKNEEVGILFQLTGNHKEIFYGKYFKTSNKGIVVLQLGMDIAYNYMLQEYTNYPLAFVHNHPNLSTISANDMIEFLSTDNIKLLIVVGNDGNISYVLKTVRRSYYKLSRIISNKLDKNSWASIYSELINNSTRLGLIIIDRDIIKYQGGI